jgi:Uma2 family endonuclease
MGVKLPSGRAMASNPITKVTAEEYLALDRAAELRSEFLDGEIIAMSGGSVRHSRLQMNLGFEIRTALKGTACEAFNSDLRVRVSSRMYTYPDLSVVCGELMLADGRQDVLLNPGVVFEVLSPSTEYYDRGLKFQRYREVESLQDYILVAQDEIRIEHYTRCDANTWTLRDYLHAEDILTIASVGVSVPLAAIYERIEFPAE